MLAGHPRRAGHQHAARAGAVPAPARRRFAVGHEHRVRRAAEPRRAGAGVSDRPRVRRRQAELPGPGRQHLLRPRPDRAAAARATRAPTGATVFGYWVRDPERYGVAEFDADGRVIGLEEKPAKPRSNYAVTGLYFYDGRASDYAAQLKPSRARRARDHRPQPRATSTTDRCTWKSSAAATPGSTPARTNRWSRPRTSSRRSRSARACASAARKRSRTSTAGSTPTQLRSARRAAGEERLRPIPAQPAGTRTRRMKVVETGSARLRRDRAAPCSATRAASSTKPGTRQRFGASRPRPTRSCRATCRRRRAACCAACTTSGRIRRASW